MPIVKTIIKSFKMAAIRMSDNARKMRKKLQILNITLGMQIIRGNSKNVY